MLFHNYIFQSLTDCIVIRLEVKRSLLQWEEVFG